MNSGFKKNNKNNNNRNQQQEISQEQSQEKELIQQPVEIPVENPSQVAAQDAEKRENSKKRNRRNSRRDKKVVVEETVAVAQTVLKPDEAIQPVVEEGAAQVKHEGKIVEALVNKTEAPVATADAAGPQESSVGEELQEGQAIQSQEEKPKKTRRPNRGSSKTGKRTRSKKVAEEAKVEE